MTLSATLLDHEPLIRLGAFVGILVAMAAWEVVAPRRRQKTPRLLRWSNNLALVIINTLLLRLSFPLLAVALASLAQ